MVKSNTLRVLYHHRTRGVGVEGVHIREFVKAIRALGHPVDVLSPPGVQVFDQPAQSGAPSRASLASRFWRSVSQRVPQLAFELLEVGYALYAYVRIGRQLDRHPYDLMYERYATLNWAGVAQAKRRGIPIIVEVNHTVETPLPRRRTRWLKDLARRVDRWIFEQADGLTVVSEELRAHLVRNFGAQSRKLIVLPNAADPTAFDPDLVRPHAPLQHRVGSRKVVGFTGRFLPWHGLDLLVEAMPRVLREAGEVAFCFVGDGPEKPRLETRLQERGLAAHAVFVGEVPHHRLPEYVAAFDVAVQPDAVGYASPMKIFEYLAMAKPTVAPRLKSLAAIITHGREGLLFKPKNADALAQALIRLLNDDALRLQMGGLAREKIVKERNWIANAQATLALARAVIGEPRGGRRLKMGTFLFFAGGSRWRKIETSPIWLPAYLRGRFRPRPNGRPVHVMFCVADHFEPDWSGATLREQLARVGRWVGEYPALAARHRDADGCLPRHTFFYPAEAYRPEVAERLAQVCRRGFGEVELHLHHDGDTADTLARTLQRATRNFARHGLLAQDRATGEVRFGFIHGNWALDNARPDGKWCGVNGELSVLAQAGCYADFTLPSAPSDTQTRKINSLYYAIGDPARRKSHDTGRDVAVGADGNGHLMIVQGPLTLNWRRRKHGVLPRIENGELSAANPPTAHRADLWIREAIHVRGREDWVFVKVHTHGAKPANAKVLLGRPMEELFRYLETAYNDGTHYRLHYVTAREMYNLIKAAEQGASGEPGPYRDLLLVQGAR